MSTNGEEKVPGIRGDTAKDGIVVHGAIKGGQPQGMVSEERRATVSDLDHQANECAPPDSGHYHRSRTEPDSSVSERRRVLRVVWPPGKGRRTGTRLEWDAATRKLRIADPSVSEQSNIEVHVSDMHVD